MLVLSLSLKILDFMKTPKAVGEFVNPSNSREKIKIYPKTNESADDAIARVAKKHNVEPKDVRRVKNSKKE